jgi:hypothetical protein
VQLDRVSNTEHTAQNVSKISSIEQSPYRQADTSSASQDLARILWNPQVHYRSHKHPPAVPILSQINPVHAFLPHFLKIHFNIILPSMRRSCKWYFSLRSPPPKPCMHLCRLPYVLHALPISFFLICLPEQYLTRSTDGESSRCLNHLETKRICFI